MGSIMQVINRKGSLYLEPIVTTGDKTPAGLISAFGGITPPSGWLLCDGSELLIADYPDLYATVGNIYGTASDADHFVLPDCRGRSPFGADANNDVGTSSDGALPNITGRLPFQGSVRGQDGSGAFRVTNRGHHGADNSTDSDYMIDGNFDASRVSSIYKSEQATVVPASVRCNFIIKY